MLIVFAGLPGTGKTAIARELARQIGAVYVRVDSIEQAIRTLRTSAVVDEIRDAGYRAGYAIAEDNLRLGRVVVADSVNPLNLTRDAWLDVANRARTRAVEVEIKCSDAAEHRRRVETRIAGVPGLTQPSWDDVVARKYEPWDREHIVIDTARQSIDRCVGVIRESIEPHL